MSHPSRSALIATYGGPYPEESLRLLDLAKRYRLAGDHIAAGDCERDAAAVIRMEHRERARLWDTKSRAAEVSKAR